MNGQECPTLSSPNTEVFEQKSSSISVEVDNGDFRSLFQQKEKELVSICERQIQFFHQQVLERDQQFSQLSDQFSQLKDDFKYNLELLDGRDVELLNYETQLATLQISIKAAKAQQQETQERLTQAESKRLEEKRRAEDKDKVYQQTLVTLRQEIESLQFTRKQLLCMHKEAFETASAELVSEVERRHADLESKRKTLEAQYHDKLQINKLQSKLVLDAMENKLTQAQQHVKQLETELDIQHSKRRDDANTENELRDEILEKDRIIKRMKKELNELQIQNDNILLKAESADFRTKKVHQKHQDLEAEYQKQCLKMRLQVEDVQKRLETAECRLREWEGEKPREITGYLEKVAQLEQVMVTGDNQLKLKLEGVETYIRESMQHQDKKVQDLKKQAIHWKAEHDHLLAKYRALQKGGVTGPSGNDFVNDSKSSQALGENKFSPDEDDDDRIEDSTDRGMASNQDLSTSIVYDLQTGSHLLTDISLPLPGQRKYTGGSTHSLGSSLPQVSPLLSPAFSSPEESMQHFLREDNRGEQENDRVASLEEENRCLRGSIHNLKEQNERIRAVVGNMRKEMEALQKANLEGALNSKTLAVSPEKGDVWSSVVERDERREREIIYIEEMKKIRDEVNILMSQIVNMTSELQQVQQMKPNILKEQQPLQPQQKLELQEKAQDVNSKSGAYDNKEAEAKIAELERVQHVLRTQLERAAQDVMRMANERDLLMEISNSLHADCNRSLQQEKIKQPPPSIEKDHYLGPAQNPSRSPEDRFHDRRRQVASTTHCPRTSPPRLRTSPPKFLWRSGGQEHSAPPKQIWINKHGTLRAFCRELDDYEDQDSKDTYPNEETEQEKEEKRLLLEGRMTPLQERPDLPQDFVHKGTPSQRSKLQASVKRREAQMASRVKVRNYNRKADDTI